MQSLGPAVQYIAGELSVEQGTVLPLLASHNTVRMRFDIEEAEYLHLAKPDAAFPALHFAMLADQSRNRVGLLAWIHSTLSWQSLMQWSRHCTVHSARLANNGLKKGLTPCASLNAPCTRSQGCLAALRASDSASSYCEGMKLLITQIMIKISMQQTHFHCFKLRPRG